MMDSVLSTHTDLELLEELSSRHGKFIAIRPEVKDPQVLKVFCNTPCITGDSAPYELYTALNMLDDAAKAIIKDCFNNKQNFVKGEDDNDDDGIFPEDLQCNETE